MLCRSPALRLVLAISLGPASIEIQGQERAPALVLTTAEIGEAYYDEAPAALATVESWMGLYVTDDGSRLEEAVVEFVSQPDGDFIVYELVADPAGPRVLFSGVDALSAGPVAVVQGWPESMWADGAVVELPLGNDAYRVRLEAADPDLCDAAVWLESATGVQRLYGPEDAIFGCDEPHFSVDWAGDLDRDGGLDLVVSFASKYSHHPRVLLLSSAAGPDELVAPAATLDQTAG